MERFYWSVPIHVCNHSQLIYVFFNNPVLRWFHALVLVTCNRLSRLHQSQGPLNRRGWLKVETLFRNPIFIHLEHRPLHKDAAHCWWRGSEGEGRAMEQCLLSMQWWKAVHLHQVPRIFPLSAHITASPLQLEILLTASLPRACSPSAEQQGAHASEHASELPWAAAPHSTC